MQNKKGKPVISPEMQKCGERFGIDLSKFNAIDDQSSATGMITHIESTEPSEGTPQAPANSSLRADQEKSSDGQKGVAQAGQNIATGGTQEATGTTVQEPDKRPTEGTETASIDKFQEGDRSDGKNMVASLGFRLEENQSESSADSAPDGTQEQSSSSLGEPLETHTDDSQDAGGTDVQATDVTPTEGKETASNDEFDVRDAGFNDVVDWFRNKPKRRRFWHGFIVERYLNCLFGRSGVGKSTICVNVVEEFGLAFPDREALWIDCENDGELFTERSTQNSERHYFPVNCRRIQPEGDVFSCMEQKMQKYSPILVVLDNLSAVCGKLEDGEAALAIAKRLQELRLRYDCTMVVIAHTPKLSETMELEQYSLGGSNKLHNSMDNIVAIARCHDLPDSIYVKHVKCRAGNAVFKGIDVAIADRVVKDGLLSLQFRRNPDGSLLSSPEFPHLKRTRDQIQAEEDARHIAELLREGYTVKQVSEQLGIPERTIYRKKKKL